MIEIDVSLNLDITPDRTTVLEKSLPPSIEVRRFSQRHGVGIRWREGVRSEGTVDAAIREFLQSVKPGLSGVDTKRAELRVGVFVELNEVACMTALISSSTVQALAEIGLAMEVSFYPCDDTGD